MSPSFRIARRLTGGLVLAGLATAAPVAAQVAVKARIAPAIKPVWEKGIVPISPESYYHAIECGKQGAGAPCVFWDTGLCKNDDFELAMYSPYKSVAYEVWRAVSQGQPAPQPSYPAAQATRITVGITPVRGSKNALTGFSLKRGGKAVAPIDGGLASGRFTFDFPAFAPTAAVTLDMVGKERTVACQIDTMTLRRMR